MSTLLKTMDEIFQEMGAEDLDKLKMDPIIDEFEEYVSQYEYLNDLLIDELDEKVFVITVD